MKLLVLDNYDSFTFNLVHMLRELEVRDLEVARNDKIHLDQVESFDSIVLSPGPGVPAEAGIMPALVQRYAPSKRILGICLGHQCIGEVFGGSLVNVGTPVHGKASTTEVVAADEILFSGLPQQIETGRYHSWVVSPDGFPAELEVTARCGETIMALRHRTHDVRGVQFHPESVLTPEGRQMLLNWVRGA